MASLETYLLQLQLKDGLTAKLNTIRSGSDKLTQSLTAGQRNVQHAFVKSTVQAGRLQGALAGVGTALSSLGLITGIAGAAFAVKNILSTGAAFEAHMSKVQALTGATREELKTLTETARQLGKTTTFSATQVAQAEGFAAMAGLTSQQIQEALPSVLNLAKATGTDLAFAMDHATNFMSQFGFQADELARVVDTVAATTASSNTNFEQLAEGMKFLGPTAKALGVDIEETSAVIGVLSSAGLQGSLGTRALGTSLVNLAKAPSKAQKDILDAYGLNFFDQQGNFIGLINTIGELEEKLKEVPRGDDRNNILATLFNTESFQELNRLIDVGKNKLSEYANELRHSSGVAERMAQTMSDNLLGSWKQFTSALQEASLTLFEQWQPALRSTVEAFTALTRSIIPHIKWIWKVIKAYLIYKVTLFAATRATKLYSLAVAATTRWMRMARIATVSLTRAWRLLNRTLLRNPFTLIASAAAIGLSFLIDWGLAANDAAEAQRDLNQAVAAFEAQTQGQKLLKTLEASGKGFQKVLATFSVNELRAVSSEIENLRDNWKKLNIIDAKGGLRIDLGTGDLAEEQRRKNLLNILSGAQKLLGVPKSEDAQAVLESVQATVTGGRRQQIVNVNIGTAVQIEDLVNQTGEGIEELQDKIVEVVVRAVNEGALQGKTALNGG